MVKIGFPKGSSVIIATAICAAMISSSFADPKGKDKNKDKGKGTVTTNNEVVSQVQTAINVSTEEDDDGNNGHGNNASGSDSSNPGNSKDKDKGGNSVLDLLGVETETGSENTGEKPSPPIIPPTTVTNNPFEDSNSTEDESTAEATTKTALPFGSVPLIKEDAASIDYLLQKLLIDANEEASSISPKRKANYENYARKLAKTLSKLSAEQQNFIFYGVKN